jgi:hypothetical protein
VASVVFTGLWSGLLLMLTTVLHPVMESMDGRGFARFLHQFLPPARKAVSNYVAVLGMLFASLIALVALASGSGGTPLALTAIGFALVVAGPLLVSNRLAEPLYDVMLAWDPDAPPVGLGSHAGALLRDQLDPVGLHLGRVRSVPRRAGGPARLDVPALRSDYPTE